MRQDDGLFGLGGRQLLVVEDNESCAEAVRAWLEICGARVETVGTVVGALSRIEHERPDLLLVDVGLPDGTGWEVVDRVRASVPGGSRIPVVAITGMSPDSVYGAARAHGVRHVLTKPIAPDALGAALSACLNAAA